MEPEISKLILEVTSDAIKILGPALITGYIAYKTGRAQHELQLKELDKSNEYKAREKLFDFHKSKLEENNVSLAALANELGQFAGMTVAQFEVETDLDKFVRSHLSTYIDSIPFQISHIKKEMDKHPDEFTQENERITAIENTALNFTTPSNSAEVLDLINELYRVYSFLGHCIRILIEVEASNIFEPYLRQS